MHRIVACCLIIGLGLLVSGASALADKQITIGYQPIYNPWKLVIAGGELGSATGYEITWRKFESGAKVINAMARGEVQIAMAGSSPIAAGVSRVLGAAQSGGVAVLIRPWTDSRRRRPSRPRRR